VAGAADRVRQRIGAAIIDRVAGPRRPSRAHRIHPAPGEHWFAEEAAMAAEMERDLIRERTLDGLRVTQVQGWAEENHPFTSPHTASSGRTVSPTHSTWRAALLSNMTAG
jgi:hypothetical protein